eukprot:c20718_g1_i2.p1 GENE.c20718_g1_i2~~c20718_g1_i2.p1  ORF type:complete len:156 (+),score=20.42 c20718_g1_i2:30-497(+)
MFSLVDEVLKHAQDAPSYEQIIWLDGAGQQELALTRAQLLSESHAIGHNLRHKHGVKHGDCVMLMFVPGLEFVCAFLGCLLAGCVAVPQYPVDIKTKDSYQKGIERVKLVADALAPNCRVCLTTTRYDRMRYEFSCSTQSLGTSAHIPDRFPRCR